MVSFFSCFIYCLPLRLCYFIGIIARIPLLLYRGATQLLTMGPDLLVNVCTGKTSCEKYHFCWLKNSSIVMLGIGDNNILCHAPVKHISKFGNNTRMLEV